eukprot:5839416-Amphidinium_carterae.1
MCPDTEDCREVKGLDARWLTVEDPDFLLQEARNTLLTRVALHVDSRWVLHHKSLASNLALTICRLARTLSEAGAQLCEARE